MFWLKKRPKRPMRPSWAQRPCNQPHAAVPMNWKWCCFMSTTLCLVTDACACCSVTRFWRFGRVKRFASNMTNSFWNLTGFSQWYRQQHMFSEQTNQAWWFPHCDRSRCFSDSCIWLPNLTHRFTPHLFFGPFQFLWRFRETKLNQLLSVIWLRVFARCLCILSFCSKKRSTRHLSAWPVVQKA